MRIGSVATVLSREVSWSWLALPAWLRRLGYYGLALLLVATGMVVRMALTRLVGPGLPTYITFYPFVMLAALIGGWGPGLLAILATAAVADYWLLLPRGLFKIENVVDVVGLAFFCVMGLFVSVVAELYRRMRDHLEELVIARTAALSQANEQLQEQAEELQTQAEELQAQTEELTTANEELRESEQALGELNATLESRVAERTEELEHRAWQLQKLTLELTEAEERERKRLAQILHDDLQQVLAAAKFHVSILGNRAKTDAALQQLTVQINDLLGDAIDKSRHLSRELSAPVLADSDLSKAFEWLAQQMQTQHGLGVHLDTCEPIVVASEPLRVLLYKAAQELLFNVIKHAGVHEATLRLRHRRGRIWLSVSDRGRGFDPAQSDHALGFGLLSIRERLGILGGRLKVRSAPSKGSTFLLAVPDAQAGESALPKETPSAQG
jgi:signal transduction histidine kinase